MRAEDVDFQRERRNLLLAVFAAAFLVGLLTTLLIYLATQDGPRYPSAQKPIVATAGLSRFPVLDSRQKIRTGIFIVCRAYSNRPAFDITAPVTDSALGFRVVSDCRTVRGS